MKFVIALLLVFLFCQKSLEECIQADYNNLVKDIGECTRNILNNPGVGKKICNEINRQMLPSCLNRAAGSAGQCVEEYFKMNLTQFLINQFAKTKACRS